MTIWVLDGDTTETRRAWDQMGFTHSRVDIEGGRLTGDIGARDVVVAHRIPADHLLTLCPNTSAVVIVAGHDGPATEHGDFVYSRGASLNTTGKEAFARGLTAFAAHFQHTGDRRWGLLEPASPPDALLAYHLLSLTPEAGGERARLRPLAINEARVIAAHANPNEGIQEAMIDNSEWLRAFLARSV